MEALAKLRTLRPDLVLLDITMPGMDGLEVCRQLREWSQVSVILLTATDTPETKVTALELGADDYLTKPFRMEELLARIRAVRRRSSGADKSSGIVMARKNAARPMKLTNSSRSTIPRRRK